MGRLDTLLTPLYSPTCLLQYPFGGLPNFPEAYPILLSGSAQSNTSVGQSVTGASSSTGGSMRSCRWSKPCCCAGPGTCR